MNADANLCDSCGGDVGWNSALCDRCAEDFGMRVEDPEDGAAWAS